MITTSIVVVGASAIAGLGLVMRRSSPLFRAGTAAFVVLCFNHRLFGEVLPPAYSLVRVTQDALFVALLIGAIGRASVPGRRILYLIVVGIGLSCLFAVPVSTSFTISGLRLTGLYLLAPIVGSMLVGRQTWLTRLMLASALPSLILAARQALWGFSPSELALLRSANSTYEVQGQARLLGAAGSGQEFSYSLLLLLSICAVVVASNRKPARRWTGLLMILLMLQALALQRSALVGSVVAVLLALWRFGRGRRARIALGGLVAGAVLALLPALLSVRAEVALARVVSLASLGSDHSFLERVSTIWPSAWSAVVERPWFGWGPGVSGPTSVAFPGEAPLGPVFTDNLFLHLGVQYGVPLAVLALIWLVVLARAGIRAPGYAGRAGGVAVVGLIVAGTAGSFIGMFDVTAPILILVGAAANWAGEPPKADGAYEGRRIYMRAGLPS